MRLLACAAHRPANLHSSFDIFSAFSRYQPSRIHGMRFLLPSALAVWTFCTCIVELGGRFKKCFIFYLRLVGFICAGVFCGSAFHDISICILYICILYICILHIDINRKFSYHGYGCVFHSAKGRFTWLRWRDTVCRLSCSCPSSFFLYYFISRHSLIAVFFCLQKKRRFIRRDHFLHMGVCLFLVCR